MKATFTEQRDAKEVIDILKRVRRQHTPQLDSLTAQLLNNLQRDAQYADHYNEIQELLRQDVTGQELLRQTSWPALWSSTERPQANRKVSGWLKDVSLDFNPFGPEVAEHDPYLPWYITQTVYEAAQTTGAMIVTGAPGVGKTATALMLAYDCGHPPANPRTAGTFPVYCAPRLASTTTQKGRSTLYPLVRTTTRELLTYLSLRPEGLLNLPTYRRDAIRRLLTLVYAGSEALLSFELGRLPITVQKALALTPPLKGMDQPPHLHDEEWLALLPETLPAGFDHYLWLVDAPDHVIPDLPDTLSINLSQLMDWAIYLPSIDIHLKLFISEQKLERLTIPAGIYIVHLEWKDKDLKQMLDDRVRQAGVDSLMALCGPSVETNCEEKLIQAAQSSPRRLIQLGNALIESAADHDSTESATYQDPRLIWQDFENAMTSVQETKATLKHQAPRLKLGRLHQLLDKHFDASELKTLCLELGIDYENLPAVGKANKAREMIKYLGRRGRLSELVAIGEKQRPNVSWGNES